MIVESPELVSREHAEAFRKDGFLLVRNLYAPKEIAEIKAHVLDILSGKDLPESGVIVWKPEKLSERLLHMMGDDHITPVLQKVVGPSVEFLSVKAVYKDRTKTFLSPWHQDWYYWKGAPKLSVWIALDNATKENGCLRLIPGSHTRVFQERHVESETGFTKRIDEKDIEGLEVVDAPCSPGDAILFHDLALHSSYPNTAGTDRWSLISTYRNASIRDASTVWEKPVVICGSSVNV
jgi:ectoine hydroxylase-related dioxygenase (phytanoyl-CoA dioxygenase family)